MDGRAIRTELQQFVESIGEWRTVAKSIVVRPRSGVQTGQWYGANGEPARCSNVAGTRKFRSVILITNGAGDVTETASNPELFGRDCADADDAVALVAFVIGSNSIEVCDTVEEILTDPNAEFTDPEVLFAQGNSEPCDGVVTSQTIPRADVEWTIAISGIGGGLAGLPNTRTRGENTEILDTVAITGNSAQDQAAIAAREQAVLDQLVPDEPDASILQEASGEQIGPCQKGLLTDRRTKSSRTRETDPAFGGKRYGPMFLTTVKYRRVSCTTWQITDVLTKRIQGDWDTWLGHAFYPLARNRNEDVFNYHSYEYGCVFMELGDTVGWDDDQGKWEIIPRLVFRQSLYVRSAWPVYYNLPGCNQASKHIESATKLRGEDR